MAQIKVGDIVKVVSTGFELPPEELAVVTGFNSSGVEVSPVKWGVLQLITTVPVFAVRKALLPQAEMIWNRIRHKEDMILRALKVWRVNRVILLSTEVAGELYKAVVTIKDFDVALRAGSLSELMKMTFMLAYFMRIDYKKIEAHKQELLSRLEALRETVREHEVKVAVSNNVVQQQGGIV